MSKVTLSTVSSFQNDTSAVAVFNANMTAIANALDLLLSRNGTSPNQMTANLDMNSNRILNIPDASLDSEPASYGQLAELAIQSTNEVILDGSITIAKLASIDANSIIGNNQGSSGLPQELTTTEVKEMLQIDRGTVATTTSGTSFDFTSIPSWVRRITVMLNGVSLSGTDNLLIQLGTSSGVQTSGYDSRAIVCVDSTLPLKYSSTSGIIVPIANAASTISGVIKIVNISGNIWLVEGMSVYDAALDSTATIFTGTALSAQLDRIRLTRTGTNTFDAGIVNIFYE